MTISTQSNETEQGPGRILPPLDERPGLGVSEPFAQAQMNQGVWPAITSKRCTCPSGSPTCPTCSDALEDEWRGRL